MLCNTRVDAPYPTPQVTCKNCCYANKLLESYAGKVSAHTSIDLYVYQSIITQATWPEFSTLIRGIAIVKMKHLRLLGEVIKLLGGKPDFKTMKNCNPMAWTANYVNPNTNIKDILKIDIQNETDNIKHYTNHIQCIKDPLVVKLLERIVLDDKQHLQCFNKILSTLPS
ncbi:MAG: ferritin-like domain-containing protein [Sarcina sp.]